MADKSNIEWTDATWNPIVGCSIVSPGCKNCYAMQMAARIERMNGLTGTHYAGTTKTVHGSEVWTDKVVLAPEHILMAPLRWKRTRKIFVNSMGDVFHEKAPDEWIDKVFAVMAMCQQHTFQVLTKRADRMQQYFCKRRFRDVRPLEDRGDIISEAMGAIAPSHWCKRELYDFSEEGLPLPNVWLGVSTERQEEAAERIPHLLQTPAAVRFISAEPLLGPIDLRRLPFTSGDPRHKQDALCGEALMYGIGVNGNPDATVRMTTPKLPRLDWIIAGGESGPKARPMHPDWPRALRDQCAAAGVPFFFKQWGEWAPGECADHLQTRTEQVASWLGNRWDVGSLTPKISQEMHRDDSPDVWRFGKAKSGRLLDGVQHDGWPSR